MRSEEFPVEDLTCIHGSSSAILAAVLLHRVSCYLFPQAVLNLNSNGALEGSPTKLHHGKRQALSLLVTSHWWITSIAWVLSCDNFKTRPLQSLMWWWSRMVSASLLANSVHCGTNCRLHNTRATQWFIPPGCATKGLEVLCNLL